MTADEHEALLEARGICDRLGKQLEVACRLADRSKKEAEEARQHAHEAAREAVLREFDPASLSELAKHAGSFLGTAGGVWRQAMGVHAGASVDGLSADFHNALVSVRSGDPLSPTVRIALGEFVVEMRARDRGERFGSGNWKEFIQFREMRIQLKAEALR